MDIRDPSIDQPHELYPIPEFAEDQSDVVTVTEDGRREMVVGSNVDNNGVKHFLLITEDPGESDTCGGCGVEWYAGHGVPVLVMQQPQVDPEQARLELIAVTAAREALGLPPLT